MDRATFKQALNELDSNQRTALLYLESLIIERSKNVATRNEVNALKTEQNNLKTIINEVYEYTSTYDQKRMFDTLEEIIIKRNKTLIKQIDEIKAEIKEDYLGARKHLETQIEDLNKRVSFAKSALDKAMYALKSGLLPDLVNLDQMPREERRQNKF